MGYRVHRSRIEVIHPILIPSPLAGEGG
jgi:hypothetical protein